jgi:phosphatidate cytidylyltransferase
MLAGRAFGRRPLAPSISPKKTVEGAVANLICAVLSALVVGWWVETGWPVSVIAGMSAGVLGQAGDLFQSWLKRSAERKDSGGLLPGHGGSLDRIDALLFAAPPTVLAYFWLS